MLVNGDQIAGKVSSEMIQDKEYNISGQQPPEERSLKGSEAAREPSMDL